MSRNPHADRRARVRRHLAVIDGIVAPIADRYREHIQCRAGCSECCQQSFRVTALEGEVLRAGLEQLAPELRAQILERARRYEPDTRTPCPALSDEGRCTLYEHRPRICRKYGIPLWHPDDPHTLKTCRLNFRTLRAPGDDFIEHVIEPQTRWFSDWIETRKSLGLAGKPDEKRSIAAWLVD